MIQAWSLHNDSAVDYWYDLVYGWYGICPVREELLMKCLIPFNMGNYKDLARPGKRLVSETGYSIIIEDSTFDGGICVANWPTNSSIVDFLEEHEEVYLIVEI